MKKTLSLIIALMIMISAFSVTVFAEDTEKEDWECVENYIKLLPDGSISDGYDISVILTLSDDFLIEPATVEKTDFPEISEKIKYIYFRNTGFTLEKLSDKQCYISFHDGFLGASFKGYSDDEINGFISAVKYLKGLSHVQEVKPFFVRHNESEAWEDCENYLNCNTSGKEKKEGFIPSVKVFVSEEYLFSHKLTVDKNDFPEIADRIASVKGKVVGEGGPSNRFTLTFSDIPLSEEITEEQIISFISAVKYLNSLDYVISTEVVYWNGEAEYRPQVETTAEEPTTDEVPVEETEQTNVSEEKSNGNKQTGDGLIILCTVSALSLSALSISLVTGKKKKNNE